MVRGPRLPISPDGQVPQRIREAELWLGAHPNHPAWLRTDDGEQSCWTPWGKTRRDNGRGRLRRFGDTLPFLVKVLAADEPLSLQAHPSAQQAV